MVDWEKFGTLAEFRSYSELKKNSKDNEKTQELLEQLIEQKNKEAARLEKEDARLKARPDCPFCGYKIPKLHVKICGQCRSGLAWVAGTPCDPTPKSIQKLKEKIRLAEEKVREKARLAAIVKQRVLEEARLAAQVEQRKSEEAKQREYEEKQRVKKVAKSPLVIAKIKDAKTRHFRKFVKWSIVLWIGLGFILMPVYLLIIGFDANFLIIVSVPVLLHSLILRAYIDQFDDVKKSIIEDALKKSDLTSTPAIDLGLDLDYGSEVNET